MALLLTATPNLSYAPLNYVRDEPLYRPLWAPLRATRVAEEFPWRLDPVGDPVACAFKRVFHAWPRDLLRRVLAAGTASPRVSLTSRMTREYHREVRKAVVCGEDVPPWESFVVGHPQFRPHRVGLVVAHQHAWDAALALQGQEKSFEDLKLQFEVQTGEYFTYLLRDGRPNMDQQLHVTVDLLHWGVPDRIAESLLFRPRGGVVSERHFERLRPLWTGLLEQWHIQRVLMGVNRTVQVRPDTPLDGLDHLVQQERFLQAQLASVRVEVDKETRRMERWETLYGSSADGNRERA